LEHPHKASNCLHGVEAEFNIEFDTSEEAIIVLNSIKPEINGSPSDRTSVSMVISGRTLKLLMNAQDTPSFRASLNSYLRWIKLSNEIIRLKNEF